MGLVDIVIRHSGTESLAQKRFSNGRMVHHVTMSYDIDADKMTDVLRIGKEKLSDKGNRSAKKRVDPLRRQTGMSRADVIATLSTSFTDRYDAAAGEITAEELATARELVRTKFATPEWINRVP